MWRSMNGQRNCKVAFTAKVAGKVVRVVSSQRMRDFLKDYLTDEREDFTITITQEDIEREREETPQTEGAPAATGDRHRETLALLRKLTASLLRHDTLLFHGSCIAVDGRGYLFGAPSGTGKSTHTRLWREMLGDRTLMVNDDKPFLQITDNGVIAYGTPWNGSHKLSTNIAVPLKAICLLSQGADNHIEPMTGEEAFPLLLEQTYRPNDGEDMARTLSLVQRLGKRVALYSLTCNMEAEAARIAYNGVNA